METPAAAEPEPAIDLGGMTKAQLLAYAAENGVDGVNSKNTKAEIISAIENA